MHLTISLDPAIEAAFRDDAAREGITLEQLAAQRLVEADLLWRIRTAAPESETRLLHRLLRRRTAGVLTKLERVRLQTLLDDREERGSRRLQDLAQLARQRSLSVRELMERLGIRPQPGP